MSTPPNVESSSDDNRIKIKYVARRFVPEGHSISAYMTEKIIEQQCAEGDTWNHVTKKLRDFYWGEFMKKYTWEPNHEEEIKATWNYQCGEQYRKLLHKWRGKRHPPNCVKPEIWAMWQTVWDDPKWKKKAETASKNRNSEPAGPGTGVTKHTAGSRSYVEQNMKMENDLGRRTDGWELFRHTHIRKDGTFVYARSQALNDAMTARVAEAMQPSMEEGEPSAPGPDVINAMFLEEAGGVKKRRVYGIGSQALLMFPEAMLGPRHRARSTASIATVVADAAAAAATTSKVEELTKENTDLLERLSKVEEQMQFMMSRLLGPSPPYIPSTFPDDDSTLPPSP